MHDIDYFQVTPKLEERVTVAKVDWEYLVTFKHPEMRGREEDVKKTLEEPEEIRQDPEDPFVYLYYKRFGDHYIRVVKKHLTVEPFIITAFPDKSKVRRGEKAWPK